MIEHPAIVSGTWDDVGSDRNELVRVATDFEFTEYTGTEAPKAFEDNQHDRCIRIIDGKLFRAFPKVNFLQDAFAKDGALRRTMFVGGMDFDPISSVALAWVEAFKGESPYNLVGNTQRANVSLKNRKEGYNENALICLRAPLLRNWRWLSADTDERVEEWREIAREFMGNFIIVEGRPYLRCFEPCYVLERSPTDAARIKQSSTHIYAKEVHRKSTFHSGLEIMGEDALHPGKHFFSATDLAGAESLADEMRWEITAKCAAIEVFDPEFAQTDFMEMETVRHARMLLQVSTPDDTSWQEGRIARDLRTLILEWQEKHGGYAQLSGTFHDLRQAMLARVSDVAPRMVQTESFIRREDGALVTIQALAVPNYP
jgi:hypothetical protein